MTCQNGPFSSALCLTVTASTSVAFQAYLLKAVKTTRKALQLVLDDVQCNVGKSFNPIAGVFTAPVSGIYQFHLQTCPEKVNQRACLWLMFNKTGKTGNKSKDTLEDGACVFSEDFTMSSTSVLTELQAGSQVWPETDKSDVYLFSTMTAFSGALLHPTLPHLSQ